MYDGECVLDIYLGPVVITNPSEHTFYLNNISQLHTKNKDC